MIELHSGHTQARIDPHGAWLTELTHNTTPILFPRQELTSESGDVKVRGGCHVCLPNFGPGGESDVPQHGFGRTLDWAIKTASAHEAVLELDGSAGVLGYQDCKARLAYTISDEMATMSLTVHNTGVRAFRLAPAFHPYFQLRDTTDAVKVNGTVYELTSLVGTEFLNSSSAILETGESTLQLEQHNLPTWALWTDMLASYVCVEPTFGGYRFLAPEQPEELLKPAEEKTFDYTIRWK